MLDINKCIVIGRHSHTDDTVQQPGVSKMWLHLDCVGMTEADIPDAGIDWYCSEPAVKPSGLCTAFAEAGGQMSPRSAVFPEPDTCKCGLLFHRDCVQQEERGWFNSINVRKHN